MIKRVKTFFTAFGIVAALVLLTWWLADAAGYARGVRDQKIIAIGDTEILNDKIEKAENAARDEAAAAADARRELHRQLLENAYERSRDPAAAGSGLPVSELRRVFRVD